MIKSIFIYTAILFAVNLSSCSKPSDTPTSAGLEQHAYWSCPDQDISVLAHNYATRWSPVFSSLKADGVVLDFGAGFDATAVLATAPTSSAQTPAFVDYQWFIWYQLDTAEHGSDFWDLFAKQAAAKQVIPATPFDSCPSALLVNYNY